MDSLISDEVVPARSPAERCVSIQDYDADGAGLGLCRDIVIHYGETVSWGRNSKLLM